MARMTSWTRAPDDIPQADWDKGLEAMTRMARGYPLASPEGFGAQVCDDLAKFRNAVLIDSPHVDDYARTAYMLARRAHYYWLGRLVWQQRTLHSYHSKAGIP